MLYDIHTLLIDQARGYSHVHVRTVEEHFGGFVCVGGGKFFAIMFLAGGRS